MVWASQALSGYKEVDLHGCDLLAQKRKQRCQNFWQFPRSPRHAKNIPTKPVRMSNDE
jgi:hypothetical protein